MVGQEWPELWVLLGTCFHYGMVPLSTGQTETIVFVASGEMTKNDQMGIEPNEHRIPRFQGKYSYHTHHSENPERPNSPNVSVMLMCGILRFCESQCFLGESGRTVGLR